MCVSGLWLCERVHVCVYFFYLDVLDRIVAVLHLHNIE